MQLLTGEYSFLFSLTSHVCSWKLQFLSWLKSKIWKWWFQDDPLPLVSQNYRGELLNVGGRTEPNHLKQNYARQIGSSPQEEVKI